MPAPNPRRRPPARPSRSWTSRTAPARATMTGSRSALPTCSLRTWPPRASSGSSSAATSTRSSANRSSACRARSTSRRPRESAGSRGRRASPTAASSPSPASCGSTRRWSTARRAPSWPPVAPRARLRALALETELAAKLMAALGVDRPAGAGTGSIEAAKAYYSGLILFDSGKYDEAVALFKVHHARSSLREASLGDRGILQVPQGFHAPAPGARDERPPSRT